jgi:transcriptional regulator with XRE-family HTH domain
MRLERMAEVRKSRGLNQRDLGARVGMDQSYVSKVERGMTIPTRVAEDIAHALSCNVADLSEPQEPTITLRVSDLSPEMLQAIGKR